LMSGLAATEHIMAHTPTPILIVSASSSRGELFLTYEALATGAIDVLGKPLATEGEGEWEQKLITAVKVVSRVKVAPHFTEELRPKSVARLSGAGAVALKSATGLPSVIAVGASTGGPAALVEILRALPSNFPLPILLVIDIGEPFGSALAEWLDTLSTLRVTFAKDGEALPALGQGRVVMAPPGTHLVVSNGRLRLTSTLERYSRRPSVDVLFESLARELGGAVAACVLTGGGKDGAAGLLEIRQAGGATLAQDEASSVVYGMPREAALLGAAQHVLPLDQIAPALVALAQSPPTTA